MAEPGTIGLDIGKTAFHAHGADARGQMVFRTRDLLVRQRTQMINAIRGHLLGSAA